MEDITTKAVDAYSEAMEETKTILKSIIKSITSFFR